MRLRYAPRSERARRQIFAQFLTESLILAAIGGAVGVALAWALLRIIMATMPPYTLPSEADVRLNLPVLLFTLFASVLSGVLAGCARLAGDALQSGRDPEGGEPVLDGRPTRLRRGLVVAEFALALTLLAGGGLAIRSLVKLTNVDLGFARTITCSRSPCRSQTPDCPRPSRSVAFYRQLLEKIEALPGVQSASASTGVPVQGTGFGMDFYFASKPVADRSARKRAGFNMVTPAYFRTFGIQMVRGPRLHRRGHRRQPAGRGGQRDLREEVLQGRGSPGPADRGRAAHPRSHEARTCVEWQIVGVYRNVKNGGPRGDGFPEIDVPFPQSPWPSAALAVRTADRPDAIRKSVAAVVQSLDPDLPVTDVKTMDQVVDEALAGDRFNAVLFATFAILALILAGLGIYGVMSFVVAQRTHEIGLRMALGARRGQVVRHRAEGRDGHRPRGRRLGSVGAYLVGRAMQGMWYGVGVMDPVAFGVVAILLLAAAMVACLVPARRAASLDPMAALRQD